VYKKRLVMIPTLLAVIVVLLCIVSLEWGTSVIEALPGSCLHPDTCTFGQRFYVALKEIGPAVGGFLVLAAAFVAVATTGWSIDEARCEADRSRREKTSSIERAAVAEIRAFWLRIDHLKLKTKLADHIGRLEENLKDPDKHYPGLFRRSLGQDWFVLFRISPLDLTLMGDLLEQYIVLSAVTRNLVSRFDYLNQANTKTQDRDFWFRYHQDVREVLNQTESASNIILTALGQKPIKAA
jgi:hypothetical protein